jgi:hypothetical protein
LAASVERSVDLPMSDRETTASAIRLLARLISRHSSRGEQFWEGNVAYLIRQLNCSVVVAMAFVWMMQMAAVEIIRGEPMFVRVVSIGVVTMPVVEVIRMSVMDYSNVPASRAVCVSFEMFLVRAPKRDLRQRDNK